MRRARTGEPGAVAALFDRHFEPLLRWAHGRLPRFARAVVDTVDVVQDAVVRTFRRLDVIEPAAPRALQAYLRRAVQNRIRDEVRRAGRRPEVSMGDLSVLSGELQVPADTPSPLDTLLDTQFREQYRTALGTLRDRDREIIVARFELDYSYEQLAEMTGRHSADTARIALRRALKRLAEAMGRAS